MTQNQTAGSLWTRLLALPRPVWILFLGTFLNKFGTFVVPFLALYMTGKGYSKTEAGLAIGAYGLGTCVASAIGGHLADTIGRRRTIVFSMFSGAASMLLLSQANSFWVFVFMTGLAGLTAEFYRPASSALLADLVPEGQRVTAFSAYRLAFNAGWAFGPATAGFLAGHSFFWLFAGDAGTSILFGLVAWFALPEGIRAKKSQAGWLVAFRAMGHDWRILRLIGASLAIGLVFMQMGTTFSLNVTGKGFSAATYGALISCNGVMVVLCELPLTTFTQRFAPRQVMAVGYVLIGIGFGLIAIANTVPLLLLVIIVFTLGEMVTMPVASAYVANLAPPHLRGRYLGIVGLSWGIAMVCGPLTGMCLINTHPQALWIGCGSLGLLAAIMISIGRDRETPGLEITAK